MNIYSHIQAQSRKGCKLFSVLIDPDKTSLEEAGRIAFEAQSCNVDFLLVGSSILTNGNVDKCVESIRTFCNIPIVLFPGNTLQISSKADGILYLSLISGRNPDLLIGKHVISASKIKSSGLEVMPTGYMLVESGKLTTVAYISNTLPIPRDKDEIASCTAIAGELLGLKLIYMDAGSGAEVPISTSMIKEVKTNISIPLIVGGGITSPEKAAENCKAGADMIVVGNVLEKDPSLMSEMSKAIHLTESVC